MENNDALKKLGGVLDDAPRQDGEEPQDIENSTFSIYDDIDEEDDNEKDDADAKGATTIYDNYYHVKNSFEYDTTNDGILKNTTIIYCDWYKKRFGSVANDIGRFKGGLMQAYKAALFEAGKAFNKYKEVKGNKILEPLYTPPKDIAPQYLSIIAAQTGLFSRIPDNNGNNEIAVKYTTGSKAHLWRKINDIDPTAKKEARIEAERVIEKYNSSICEKMQNVLKTLFTKVDSREYNKDANLIPFNNGVFQYTSDHDGILIDWQEVEEKHPDWTFRNKLPFDLKPFDEVEEPKIVDRFGNDWHVIDAIKMLMYDEDSAQALLEILAAGLRPQVNWKSLIFFLDCTKGHAGNNGKSTMTQLMEATHGGVSNNDGQIAVLSVRELGERFGVSSAIEADLIIAHENDPKMPANSVSTLKSIANHDPVNYEAKFKTKQGTYIDALVVQCFNQLPNIGDLTGSMDRRIKALLFTKSFTGTGKENPDVKEDYLKRKDVLEYLIAYLVYKIGRLPNGLPARQCYTTGLQYFNSETDSVARFYYDVFEGVEEITDENGDVIDRKPIIKNDYLSISVVYEIYLRWYEAENNGDTARAVKSHQFKDRFGKLCDASEQWTYREGTNRVKKGAKVNQEEPILKKYYINRELKDTKAIKNAVFRSKFE